MATWFIPEPINVFEGFVGNITSWNYEAVAQNFVLRRWTIFVTIALIRKISYFMCNVQKSEHIFNMPQNKEFLIYLHDLNCQQNSQVFLILGPSFKALSMTASVLFRITMVPIFWGHPVLDMINIFVRPH